jgi:hypothetical protein
MFAVAKPQTAPEDAPIRRQAELMAIQAVDALRQVAPEIAPVFERGGARALIVDQYVSILEGDGVRWEGRL